MPTKTTILLSVLILDTTLSCQPTATQGETKLKGNFLIQFIEINNTVRAAARFQDLNNENPDVKSITIDKVIFQGLLMEYKPALEEYRASNTKSFESKYTIEYQTADGISGKQTLAMEGLSGFSVQEEKIDKSDGFTLSWNGEPLAPDEELMLMFDIKNQKPINMGLLGPTTANFIKLNPQQLTKLPTGTHSLSLIKRKNFVLKGNGLADGGGVVEYYTRPIGVEIVE